MAADDSRKSDESCSEARTDSVVRGSVIAALGDAHQVDGITGITKAVSELVDELQGSPDDASVLKNLALRLTQKIEDDKVDLRILLIKRRTRFASFRQLNMGVPPIQKS